MIRFVRKLVSQASNRMPFQRKWDASCPKTWDRFEKDGRSFVIQDIHPEDDEYALQVLLQHLCTDEVLCKLSDFSNDQESLSSITAFWRECLSQRMSLGCYTEVEGKQKLVAMNVCVVDSIEDNFPTTPIKGTAWNSVYDAMAYLEAKCNAYEYLKLDVVLHAYGLVVAREFRGAKLGAKLLMAREPLSRAHGVKGTTTVFTGAASQTLASRCGFTTIYEATLKEIAEAGYDYPKTDHVIKLMVKKFSEN